MGAGPAKRKKNINRFRVLSKNGRKPEFLNTSPSRGTLNVSPLSEIKSIPKVPTELKDILLTFNDLCANTKSNRCHTTKKIKPINKNFNGFMAFRSFYCKSVSQFPLQCQLSQKLADIWKKYRHKDYWNTVAEVYKLRGNTNQTFVEWLCEQLNISLSNANIKHTRHVRNLDWSKINGNHLDQVEDVFIDNSIIFF